jgi:hypothetical protein
MVSYEVVSTIHEFLPPRDLKHRVAPPLHVTTTHVHPLHQLEAHLVPGSHTASVVVIILNNTPYSQ